MVKKLLMAVSVIFLWMAGSQAYAASPKKLIDSQDAIFIDFNPAALSGFDNQSLLDLFKAANPELAGAIEQYFDVIKTALETGSFQGGLPDSLSGLQIPDELKITTTDPDKIPDDPTDIKVSPH
jgi:hypothetical protein